MTGHPRADQYAPHGTGARAGKGVARLIANGVAARTGVVLLARALPPPRVELTCRDIVVSRLPAALDGLRLLHLSDLHLRPGSALAWQIPALVADLSYDLACYTGDVIDSDADLPRLAVFLRHMPRPTEARAYAVLGNHDYTPYGRGRGANDVRRLRQVLAAASINVLTNESRSLCEGRLYIAGAVRGPPLHRGRCARAASTSRAWTTRRRGATTSVAPWRTSRTLPAACCWRTAPIPCCAQARTPDDRGSS